MKVLAHVAGFVNAGEAGANAEVHVCHEAVLGVAGSDADGAGIAVPDLKIDVADRGVESAGAGIGGLTAGSTSPGGGSPATANPASRAGPATGKEDHIALIVLVLVAGSAFAQEEHGAGRFENLAVAFHAVGT